MEGKQREGETGPGLIEDPAATLIDTPPKAHPMGCGATAGKEQESQEVTTAAKGSCGKHSWPYKAKVHFKHQETLPHHPHRLHSRQALTFTLLGTKAAGGLGARAIGRIERGFLVVLCIGDLTVHLVGQVPQEADTVFHQLAKRQRTFQLKVRLRRSQGPWQAGLGVFSPEGKEPQEDARQWGTNLP